MICNVSLSRQLLVIVSNGKETHFEYDGWGNLSKALFEDGKTEHRNPDKSGNLFETLNQQDRKYAKGGQLIKTEQWTYKYDSEGNLKEKKDKRGATWQYQWNPADMLAKVKRPDAREVRFKYDALGRRIEKCYLHNKTTYYMGRVPLHEYRETYTRSYDKEQGEYMDIRREPVVTWVFEEGTFVPVAKLTEIKKLSIVTNYLGTPEAMYDEQGEKNWSCDLNSFGKVRNFEGQWKVDCPFRYQGQYEDAETGLYYNRFRYYDPNTGNFISKDPIGLAGGNPTLYGYVFDSNTEVDIFGLDCSKAKPKKGWQAYEKQIQDMYGDTPFNNRKYRATVNGKRVNGIADNVAVINGKSVAIEAKYVNDWSKSIRNPNSKIGGKSFAIAEQQKMLSQAKKYSNAFDEVIYHTNSPDLATHYTKIFQEAGLGKVKINITP